MSFGGPEGPEEVRPFLENVVRGRGVPQARLEEAERHYRHFGGASPINARNRVLVAALRARLAAEGLRVYWGNRLWRPYVADVVRQMADDGVGHAFVFVTSAFDSPAGFTRYVEDVERARGALGGRAPVLEVLPPFFDQPLFVEAHAAALREALAADLPAPVRVLFTAHSIPVAMARACPYEAQLRWACSRIAAAASVHDWSLVYQSRSGRPDQAWLEPDVLQGLAAAHAQGVGGVVLSPVGFVTDHMEVLWDLDVEAAAQARELGLGVVRAATVCDRPAFVEMIAGLVTQPAAVSA